MEPEPKNKICILTQIAMVGAAVCVVLFVSSTGPRPIAFFWKAILVLLIVLPLLTMASLIRISLHSDRLKGRLAALVILAVSSFFLFSLAVPLVPRAKNWPGGRIVCGTILKGLGTAFFVYARDYEGFLLTDNWCDRLIEDADVSPKSLMCPTSDAVEGESDYCLNIHAAGKRLDDLPADMVLLFETTFVPAEGQRREPIRQRPDFHRLPLMREIFTGDEKVYLDRWNQVGGPEQLAWNRHDGGCYVLFADGHTNFVRHSELPTLRWNIENTVFFEMPPEPAPTWKPITMPHPDILLLVLGGVSVIVAGNILAKYKALRCWKFALLLGVLSAATGWLFGMASEAAYSSSVADGGWAGLFFGALAGSCFAAWLADGSNRLRQVRSLVWFSISVGMATGVLCSTLVHLALMIVNQTANPFGIVIGIPFGAFAGAILGLIGGAVAKTHYPPGPTDEA